MSAVKPPLRPARCRPPGPAATSRWGRPGGEAEHQLRGLRPRGDRRRLCLFDDGRRHRDARPARADRADASASGTARCPGVPVGQRYGFRADGPVGAGPGPAVQPAQAAARPLRPRGQRRRSTTDGPIFGYRGRRARPRCAPRSADPLRRDSAPYVPQRWSCTTTSTGATTRQVRPRAWTRHRHLRAARQGLHRSCTTGCPSTLRGTYAGLATAAVIDYLSDLGVTAVELLPVHQFVSEPRRRRARADATTGATTRSASSPRTTPTPPPATAASRSREFKAMVKALHAAGLEVILDVVYNHTAEGGAARPDAVASAGSTTRLLQARRPRRHRRAATPTGTSPAAATPSTPRTRRRCG